MDLEAVSTEIGTALAGIIGLRIPAWGVESVEPPAAIVALPDRIDFDETYGRGKDHYPDLPVVILVGAPEDRASRKALAAYAAGSGSKSVKAVLEAYAWTTCESVRVAWAEFDQGAEYAGTPLLAAIFHLDIIGKGA
ncbi:hypothetical protein [Actinoplanes sp. NPDC051851]|uniref:hypothetical protein n=1 Tax=Actinoplanes sp. NPDC051851 TaxID=3154753 RepID=UPI00342C851E